ncbi:hypothetical protein BZG75_14975 [Salinivibrio sp. AR640]|nr:hypothetical protein BZG75_14975 [Salinivibrio sp. AR640]
MLVVYLVSATTKAAVVVPHGTLNVYLRVFLWALQLDVVNGLIRQKPLMGKSQRRVAARLTLSVYLKVFLGLFN